MLLLEIRRKSQFVDALRSIRSTAESDNHDDICQPLDESTSHSASSMLL